MNRLFITTVCGFLVALAASSAASYWLALNPPLQVSSHQMVKRLEDMGQRLHMALANVPERDWEEMLLAIEGTDLYFIDWFDALDYELPVEDKVTLESGRQVLSYLVDGTPVLEILFEKESLVVEVVPMKGYDNRLLVNGAATVAAVLLIGLVAALLTLVPTAKRLRRLQVLAWQYSLGNFAEKNTDDSKDSIGKLGQSMESMADQIQDLFQDNAQLLSDQQELMRAVAHEFRAPMARMRFALEMNSDSELNVVDNTEISVALDELDDLVTEVLRFARLQHSAPALSTVKVNLAHLVADSVAAVQALRPQVPVEQALHSLALEVTVDSVQFQRALRNLISNALKYTHSRVRIGSEIADGQLSIHVDDDGPGIDVCHRKRILTPFVRLDSSRTRAEGGSGLGLAIAHGVLAKHGGDISVSDSPEGGARFTLRLPT